MERKGSHDKSSHNLLHLFKRASWYLAQLYDLEFQTREIRSRWSFLSVGHKIQLWQILVSTFLRLSGTFRGLKNNTMWRIDCAIHSIEFRWKWFLNKFNGAFPRTQRTKPYFVLIPCVARIKWRLMNGRCRERIFITGMLFVLTYFRLF